MTAVVWFSGGWVAVGVVLVRVSAVLVAGLVGLGVVVWVEFGRGWWL